MIQNWFQGAHHPNPQRSGSRLSGAGNRLGSRLLAALLGAAGSSTLVPLTHAAGNAELLSVDFVVGGSGGNGSGQTAPCSGDTVLSGSTMNNAAGNLYSGQTGPWNALNIGTYNQNSATSGYLSNGAGTLTTAKMVLGLATGLTSTPAGGWRCSPNEGTPGNLQSLRSTEAYLYNGVITGDHFAWGFTGLVPNANYRLTLFGDGGTSAGASNVAGGVAGSLDSEGDWNWSTLTADSSGTITGIFTAPNPTLGLYGAQLEHLPRTQPPQSSPTTPAPADGTIAVATAVTLTWSTVVGAESYDVYLWPGSGAKPATPTASVTVGQYTPAGFLSALTSYSWQVVARNPVGVMNSPVWAFTTDEGRPIAPSVPSPAVAATHVLVETPLDWNDSLGATSYQVFVWLASGSKPATATATLTSSSYLLTQPLLGNSLYNWQVVAINGNGATAGPVWTFTTGERYPGYLIPWPKSVTVGNGDFPVTAATRIVAQDPLLLPLAQVMARDLFMASGLTLTTLQGSPQAGDITLAFNPILTGEAYTLDSTGPYLVLSGQNYQAVAWASVTLLQALNTTGTPASVPQMVIADQPASPLRTVMWDIGRFFHPLETLYEFVDLHRMYKVTYMHLYMSADGLFTFGSTAFPGLAKTNDGSAAYTGSPGFYLPPAGSRLYYTKAELTALVAYARDRGVVIVPEIDTPNWAAYMTGKLPATFCSTGGATATHYININYPTAVAAVKTILDELAAVFSTSPYIHIGADEVSTTDFESYPYYATSKAANNYASGAEGMLWFMSQLNTKVATTTNPPGGVPRSAWSWTVPGSIGKGYDLPTNLVYTAWGYDDGQGPSASGYPVMRAAGGHVAGMGQANNAAPYNRCLLYRPAQGIYNRLTPLARFIGAPDNIYTDLTPTFLPITGTENKIVGAHIMEWETPYEVEVPAFRLSMPALGEPTWNQEASSRRNWDNFLMRQKQTDALYQRVMRPVSLNVTTQVDPKDVCFVAGGMVTMNSPVAGTIRYTIGTDYNNSWYNFPTSSSNAYTAPFAITQSSVISARLFDAAGNPLGNPVTRGFYLITPKTHYQYFFTGNPAPSGFEKATPIVSSVMGMMNGNAPQEDVRFGDTEHRTIYSGALNITTAGAYTFSATYGGTISIDRVALADGTPLTLTAGEHIFKIVTPASGLGTPYTYSGGGASAGTDLNNLLKPLSSCSQVFPASYGFGTQSLSLGATAQKEITIVNHSIATPLTITSVQLAGTNPGEFLISADSGESVLAPGAQRIVAVCFNPATAGNKSANLHVVAANLPGGAADSALTGNAVAGTLPSTPNTPTPANAASGVTTTPTLDWADAAGATSYDVYLWLASGSKPATPNTTVAVSQWTPPALTNGVNYYWQVVATNANGTTSGPQWGFHTGTSTVQFSNVSDGQVFRYSMVLVDGTFDGGSTLTIAAAPVSTALSFTKYGTRFRCLVDLRPGTNTLTITDGHGAVALNLVFTPPTSTDYRFQVWYVVPSDEANSPVDPLYATHFSLQAKLMQSWMAEDQLRAGHGRLTFYPILDASSNIDVQKLVLTQTRAQATALGTGMYGEVYNQIPAAYKDGVHKNLAFSSVAFNALGSGDLCYVGAYSTAGFHPADATQMMTKLLSSLLGNDNALNYSNYVGVTLHETCHCLHQIWHDTSLYNIMSGSGYDISQYFTLTYSDSNPAPHGESSAGTLGKQRDLAAWNRYLMSADPQVYHNTTVGVSTGPENLTATSAYPLAVFQYYIPETPADQPNNLVSSNVLTYSKHAGQARLDLGTSPYNVMAVDTQGNMSYNSFSGTVPVVPVADSYSLTAGTTVTPAPGVLANDINPSNSTLSASVAIDVLHGSLTLNANGGFSYTPTAGYVGTDTFTYKVSDGVSNDQTALVTLTVTAVQMTQPTTPLPSTGAGAVLVNTALDWADVIGATSYDVYLWVTAQTKPATATANVTASNYVPPATLMGSTNYSWQVVAKNSAGTISGPVWTFATAVQASDPTGLISVDLTYSDIAVKTPYSGDTTLTGTLNKNSAGLIFTGQTGAWNGVNVGGNNANNGSASLSNLKNATGGATTISFAMGTATSSGSSGGGWRNGYLSSPGGNLREEQAYLYYPDITGDHFDWEFSGLTPNAHYQLVAFASTGALSNVANGVAGSQDAEGDWNWADVTATAAGRITGRYTDTTPTTTPGIYGFQIYKQAVSAPLAANAGSDQTGTPATLGASPVASGGTAPYTYSWSPSTGLSSSTVANPTANPAATTIYTLTVTDFLGATATDSVLVTVGGSTVTTLTSSPLATGPYGTVVAFTATVSPAAPGSVVFKDGATTLGSATLASGVATFTTPATALAMGSHAIGANYAGSGSFTASASAAYTYMVTAKPVTITGVTATTKVYDKTTSIILTGGIVSGVIGSEIVVVGNGIGSLLAPDVGNQPVTATGYGITGANAGNYILSAQPAVANATISPKPLTISGITAAPKIYDGTTAASIGGTPALQQAEAAGSGTSSDGKPYSGDIITVSGTPAGTLAAKDVGTRAVSLSGNTLTGAQAANYTLTQQTGLTQAITPKGLQVSGLVVPPSKPYDGNTNATVSGTATGLLAAESIGSGNTADEKPYAGDTVAVNGSSNGSATYNSKDVATATSVSYNGLILTGTQAPNYTLQTAAGITPKPLVLLGSRNYDGSTAIDHSSLSISNKLGSDDVSLASGSGVLAGRNAGTQVCVGGSVVTPVRVGSYASGSTGANSATSFSVTIPAPTSGNTLVAIISTRSASASAVTGIVQSGAALWTRAAQSTGTAGTTTEIWHAPNIQAAGTTVTIQLAAPLMASAVVAEYSGVLVAGSLDQTANSSGSGIAAVTGSSATTTQANELWLGGIGLDNSTLTLGTPVGGFVSIANAQSSGASATGDAKIYALEKLPGATGTAASGGTITGTTPGTIAQRGVATTASITTAGSVTISKPNGVVAGDVMIATLTKIGSTTALSAPTGWAVVSQAPLRTVGTLTYAAVMYRVADGSDASVSSYTFNLGTTTTAVGDMVAFSNVDAVGGVKQDGTAGGPFDVAAVAMAVNTSGSTSVTASALTTASANAAVIMCGMAGGSATWSAWTCSSSGTLTEVADNHQTTAASVGIAWATKAAPGTTGAGAATLSSSQRNGGILLALRPAPAIPQWSGAVATFKPQAPALSGSLALGGTSASNYTLAAASGSATINPLPLTISAVPASKTYDGTLAAAGTPTLTSGAIQPGDTAAAWTQAFTSAAATAINGATLTPVPLPVIDGNNGSNYSYTYASASGTIYKALATLTLDGLRQDYDGSPKMASATTIPPGLSVDLTYDTSGSAPSAVGTYAVAATVNDPNYTGTASASLVITGEPIAAWRSRHFTADEIAAGLAADAADADGDGLSNLTEYTLGTDPRAFTPAPLVLTRAADNSLSLTFMARRATGAGYEQLTRKYSVQGSADLANPAAWQPLPGYAEVVGDDQTVTVALATDGPLMFYRLHVRLE